MLFFQSTYKEGVSKLLADKEHVSDGIGSEQFLYYILIASVFFFALSIGMTAYMLLLRAHKNKKKNATELLVERYQDFLSSFLILPIDNAFLGIQKSNNIDHRLSPKDVSDPYRREILAQEIYNLKKDLCGQQAKQLTNYFFGLGLQAEVVRMVRSANWSKKVKGMQLVASFKVTECLADIQSFINSENRELAIHAIVTVLTIDNSLDVLNDIEEALNDWECHKIVSAINQLNIPNSQLMEIQEVIKNKKSPLHRLSIGLIKKESVLELA